MASQSRSQCHMASLVLLTAAACAAALAPGRAAAATAGPQQQRPQLFMDLQTDIVDAWGLLESSPTALEANKTMARPPANYSTGATVFAAFDVPDSPGLFEVFVAVGRPGEPLLQQPLPWPAAAAAAAAAGAGAMKVVNDSNAISSGPHTTASSVEICEAACEASSTCLQWTFNEHSHHCFSSEGTKWEPAFSDHCISGCKSDQVENCGSAAPSKPPAPPAPPGGVVVERYTTTDFVSYSEPMAVLYLPNNSPGHTQAQARTGDGGIWTVKSMDRNEHGYLLLAFYTDSCSAFASPLGLAPHSFKSTRAGGVFKDHDDSNLIWSRGTDRWVDMQIMGSPWRFPNGSTTICPHNLSDNGGCKGGPRTVSVRTSEDGVEWSGDWGCAQPSRTVKVDPAVRRRCEVYNESGIIRPHPTEDPVRCLPMHCPHPRIIFNLLARRHEAQLVQFRSFGWMECCSRRCSSTVCGRSTSATLGGWRRTHCSMRPAQLRSTTSAIMAVSCSIRCDLPIGYLSRLL
jgi:hypothetical protein